MASVEIKREVEVPFPLGSAAGRRAVAGGFSLLMILGFAVVVALPERRITRCTETREEIATLQAREYAQSAYLLWRRNHPERDCPATLGELNEYTNRKPDRYGRPDIADTWGNDMHFVCGKRANALAEPTFVVWSDGPDGAPGTRDDLMAAD